MRPLIPAGTCRGASDSGLILQESSPFRAWVSTHLRTGPEPLSPDGSVLPAYTPTPTSTCSVIRITRPAAPGHFSCVPAFVVGPITGTPSFGLVHFPLPLPAAVAMPARTTCPLSATAAALHPRLAEARTPHHAPRLSSA
jgi:hypothetical protein